MRTVGDKDWSIICLAIFIVIFLAVLTKGPRTDEKTSPSRKLPTVKISDGLEGRPEPPPEAGGSADPSITQENIHQTICSTGYTRAVRPATSFTERIKRQRMLGLPGSVGDYELDHVIPLELGGCATCEANLWMQPIPDALKKDRVEDYLHKQVCSNNLSLSQAQNLVSRAWYPLYVELQNHR